VKESIFMPTATSRRREIYFLLMAVAVTTAIYWLGLSGSFAFDDTVFLIANHAIQVSSLNLSDWVAAAFSFPAGSHQGRWLGMLSFATNHYFTGMDPFAFKLTNLIIHLVNGMLLFLALNQLFRFYLIVPRGSSHPAFRPALAAAALAALWLVLPINLTGVLYISQRLESLSNTFVFLGLWWYLRARLALWENRKGPASLWLALLISTGLGVLTKESAILLPLYTACTEYALTGGRDRKGHWSRPIIALYGTLLVIPLIAGLIWLTGWIGGPQSYGRAFDIPQRLMTESRVLIEYIVWILAPNLDSLTLFHDDIQISRGLLDPPTTILAFTTILGLIAVAFWQQSRRPLLSLGILWYFGGHLLTATVIPLMLVFEHRNYFPSVGILLAISSVAVLEGPRLRTRTVATGFILLFLFYSFTTCLRALEWSSPLTLTASDASKRPESSAAQYEYALVLLRSTLDGDPEPMRRKAFSILEKMAANPKADAVHNQLLIVASADRGMPIRDEWWESMIAKLAARPVSSVDVSAMSALVRCFDDKICPRDIEHLHRAFAAATSHPGGYAQLLASYGQFAFNYLNDTKLAEEQTRLAIRQSPNDAVARSNLVSLLIALHRPDEAELALIELRKLNRVNELDRKIDELTTQLARLKSSTKTTNAAEL
jgi:protein O-mannosyl-transferase